MDHEPAQAAWVVPAALVVATALGQLLTVEPWSASFVAQAVWFQGAILMCGLLCSPPSRWLACIAAAMLGSALLCMEMGRMLLPHCVVLAGEFALVGAATWWLRPADGRSISELRGGDPAKFVLLAGIALPILEVAWVIAASRQLGLALESHGWVHQVLSRSLGYLVLVPAFASVMRLVRRRAIRTQRLRPAFAALGVVALVLLWTSPLAHRQSAPLLLLAPVVLLVWGTHALGSAWTWVVWSVALASCLWLSALGVGPLVNDVDATTVARLQWWAIGTSVLLVLLTALHDQRGLAHVALRESYERLSQLARRVMTMQENERSRIARDLHDDVNQSLASISIELSGLKRNADEVGRERIEALQEHLLGVSDDIRRLSHELHPSMLRYTSLAASLEALCASHTRDELRVHCDTEENFALSEQQKLELFRIAQEALHNAEKHADATQVRIALRREGKGALLRIEDDGRGLPPDYDASHHGGLGMISMAERVKTLRGEIVFSPAARGGTRVDVRFPVAAPTR